MVDQVASSQAGPFEASIRRLLNARSVAIVGASEKAATIGGGVLANLDRAAFAGPIHLVSRTRDRIGDRPCIPSIADLPAGVDAVVLAVPAEAVPDAVQQCIARNVGGVVVFASGFSEAGSAGVERQSAIRHTAEKAGLAVLGPNCVGFTNYFLGLPLTFSDFTANRAPTSRRVGILAQSGAILAAVDEGLYAKGIASSYAISTGNEAVVGLEDCLGQLIDDADTHVVAVFAEQIRNAPKFLNLADRAQAAGKPVVLMHPGRTQRARASAESHTGAMAGDHASMQAVLRAHGVRVVASLDELLDVTAMSAHWPRPKGPGVMIMTNSGALRSVTLDFADSVNLDLPLLANETKAKLAELLPPSADLDNPLDLLTTGLTNPDIYGQAGAALMSDPQAGGLVFTSSPGPAPVQVSKGRNMFPLMQNSEKPVAFVMQSDEAALASSFLEMSRQSALPLFRSTDRALRAMVHMTGNPSRLERRELEPSRQLDIPSASGPVAEYRAKILLSAAGIATPAGRLTRTIEEAVAAATVVGYPVVLKAQADALTHKSDVGGVVLNIRDEGTLRDAWSRMQSDVARLAPGIPLDGVLVEGMSPKGVEMIVGARRDPNWGPVILAGLGGVTAEAIKDIRIMAAGLDRDTIRAELGLLRGAPLLRGFRGAPPCDEDALVETIARLGEIMIATPDLSVVEINPLVVFAEGQGAIALDALLIASAGGNPKESRHE